MGWSTPSLAVPIFGLGGTVGEGGRLCRATQRKGLLVNKNNNSSDEVLRKELLSLGAREFEVVALTMDADRGLAALRYAISKGAEHPVPYAIKVFDNPDWTPTNERPRRATNVSAPVTACSTCGGDRFVLVGTRPAKPSSWMVERGIKPPPDVPGMEEYAACPDCSQADTGFFRHDGSKARALDPAEVRERMNG